MKLSVGYQLRGDGGVVNTVIENSESISEVYFAYPNFANGRNTVAIDSSLSELSYMSALEGDFERLTSANISLNLLLNGMCYGKYAQSRVFFNKIGDTVEYLSSKYNLKTVTTTSPLIAKFFKQNFPDIKVRASVNSEIGSIEGMDYLKEYFDSFYAKRESNKDLELLKRLRKWCDNNGKELYGLANSGCLNNCSAHIFHDNLVSHENEIAEMDNAYRFEGQCRTYLSDTKKREDWLRLTNFIRPEDVELYEGIFDGIKLATRVNKNPKKIIEAYLRKSFNGNLPEILEPDHSALFYPFVVENKKLPKNFGLKTTSCNRTCEACNYCKEALADSLICLE